MTETIDRTSAAPTDGPERLSRSDAIAIGVLLVSAFVVVLNETIMSVAIPVLIKDLHVDASAGQWLSTAFILTMAVVIPVSGFLIQSLTTRTLFAIALGSFVLGTLLAALSPTFGVLLVARVIQGIGAAVITPLLMTTVMTIVPESRRGAMMGNISIVISVAPAIGPTVSGLILNALPWPQSEALDLPPLYQAGIWAALVIGIGFTSVYAWRIASESTRMSAGTGRPGSPSAPSSPPTA